MLAICQINRRIRMPIGSCGICNTISVGRSPSTSWCAFAPPQVRRSLSFLHSPPSCSLSGLRPVAFLGAFFMENTTDMEMSALDAESGLHIELRHDDKLPEGSAALIQTAVLFTSVGGQRRLRIHNMQLPVSGDFAQMYRMADQDALVSFLFKSGKLSL